MKEKLLNFIIGFLIGATITILVFLIFENKHMKHGPGRMNQEKQSQMIQNDFNKNTKKSDNSTNKRNPSELPSDKKTNRNAPQQNNSIKQPEDNSNIEKGQG